MHKLNFSPEAKNALELLTFSNVTILDNKPFQKGHNMYYKTQCNNCKRIYNKASCTFGKTKCQCFKAVKGAYNYNGYEDICSIYFNRVKERADARDIKFHIDKEMMWNKYIEQKGKCALTGLDIKLQRNYKKRGKMTASLDRIDSDKDYTLDNIQWVHKDVNRMKNAFSEEYFLEICKLVVNKSKSI